MIEKKRDQNLVNVALGVLSNSSGFVGEARVQIFECSEGSPSHASNFWNREFRGRHATSKVEVTASGDNLIFSLIANEPR